MLSQEYLQTVERTGGEETGENRGWREQRLERTEEGENRPREEREERQREKKQRWTHPKEKLNFIKTSKRASNDNDIETKRYFDNRGIFIIEAKRNNLFQNL